MGEFHGEDSVQKRILEKKHGWSMLFFDDTFYMSIIISQLTLAYRQIRAIS